MRRVPPSGDSGIEVGPPPAQGRRASAGASPGGADIAPDTPGGSPLKHGAVVPDARRAMCGPGSIPAFPHRRSTTPVRPADRSGKRDAGNPQPRRSSSPDRRREGRVPRRRRGDSRCAGSGHGLPSSGNRVRLAAYPITVIDNTRERQPGTVPRDPTHPGRQALRRRVAPGVRRSATRSIPGVGQSCPIPRETGSPGGSGSTPPAPARRIRSGRPVGSAAAMFPGQNAIPVSPTAPNTPHRRPGPRRS